MKVFTVCEFTHCSDDREPTGYNKVTSTLEAAKALVQESIDVVLAEIAESEGMEPEVEIVEWTDAGDGRWTAVVLGDTNVTITEAELV